MFVVVVGWYVRALRLRCVGAGADVGCGRVEAPDPPSGVRSGAGSGLCTRASCRLREISG